MKKVDFIGIGAHKAGTTWLFNNLNKHPSIQIPKEKGLHYFNKFSGSKFQYDNKNYEKPISWYHSQFDMTKKNELLGECTPFYLSQKNVPQDVFNYNKSMKLILVVRNPIQRAFSTYLYCLQNGFFGKISFEEALKKEPIIIEYGKYSIHLKEYLKYFTKDKILIIKYDYLKSNPKDTYLSCLKFLGQESYIPSDLQTKINVTKKSFLPLINNSLYSFKYHIERDPTKDKLNTVLHNLGILKSIDSFINFNQIKMNSKPEINRSFFNKLLNLYSESISELEEIADLDLENWKNKLDLND